MLKVKKLLALLALTAASAGCGEMWGMEDKNEKTEGIKPVIIYGNCQQNKGWLFAKIRRNKNEKGEYTHLLSNAHEIFSKTKREELEKEIEKEGGNTLELNGTIYIKRGPNKSCCDKILGYLPINTLFVKRENLKVLFIKISEELENCISNIPQVEKGFVSKPIKKLEKKEKEVVKDDVQNVQLEGISAVIQKNSVPPAIEKNNQPAERLKTSKRPRQNLPRQNVCKGNWKKNKDKNKKKK